MPKIVQDAATFVADRAWGARDLADVEGASVRLHWTDQPYKWHQNDGAEAFVVLQGEVDMFTGSMELSDACACVLPTSLSQRLETSMSLTQSGRLAFLS